MKILVTGCAGFIGFHVCLGISNIKKVKLFGIDNLNNYYDVKLKNYRLNILKKQIRNFKFYKIDISNKNKLLDICKKNQFTHILHFAAQAGVRYALKKPESYINNNVVGFFNILEASRLINLKHLVYASSSSVYGDSKKFPVSENFETSSPLSLYASTKKSNEVLAHSYSSIYKIPITGLRLFTIYGPYGRPDMALYKFTDAIIRSKKINLYNYGNHNRDFTYIDDLVMVMIKLLNKKPKGKIPNTIFNVGYGKSIKLKNFLHEIEKCINKKTKVNKENIQKGDVLKTHSDIKKINNRVSFKPKTDIKTGIAKYIDWHLGYYLTK